MLRSFLTIGLISLFSNCAFADGMEGFDSHNLYASHGMMGTWSSFAQIGGSLLLAGWALRSFVLVKLAITGDAQGQNLVMIVAKLIVAAGGMVLLQKLL